LMTRCIMMVEEVHDRRDAVTPIPTTEVEVEELTLADLDASVGTSPDRTGDFEAGRTHFHASSEEFLACIKSQPYERNDG